MVVPAVGRVRVDDGREREGARREGGLVEEDEPVGGEREEAAAEGREAGVLLGLEVDERKEVPLDLAGGQHRPAGRRDGRGREPVGCGDGHGCGEFGLQRFSRRRGGLVFLCKIFLFGEVFV